MKRVSSAFFSLLLLFAFALNVSAATDAIYSEMVVTAESATVYAKASTKSDKLGTVKSGYVFTPTGETKSFWKIEFLPKDSEDKVVGYILKKYAAANAKSDGGVQAAGKTESAAPAIQKEKPAASAQYYWVPNGKSHHASRNCSTLKRSKTILSGTLQEALDAGKDDPCNVCAGGT